MAMKNKQLDDLMIISVEQMIAYLSTVMTLKPGDVVLTGSTVGAELVSETMSLNAPSEKLEPSKIRLLQRNHGYAY